MKKLLSLLAISLLVACAGTPFKWDAARQIKEGMTEKEVTALMGAPYMVTSAGEKQTWVWSHANAFGGAKSLALQFKDGKVIKTPDIPDSFE